MTQFEYYDFRAIQSRGALWSIVAGPRSIGKTYGSKLRAVKRGLKTGEQTIWLRRSKTELTPAKAGFFDSIAPLYPGFDFRVEGDSGQVRTDGGIWQTIIRFIPLSLSAQYKGTEFPMVVEMVYDECFAEPGMHYLADELDRLQNFWITVNRGRLDRAGRAAVKVTLLGNAVALDNPYFLEYGFTADKEWQKGKTTGGDVVLHLVDARKYERRVGVNIYGGVLSATAINYAEGDYFRPDGGYVVEKRPADSRPFATLVTLRGTFGLWESADYRSMYVTVGPLASPDAPVVAFEPMAVRPGVILADSLHFIRKNTRRNYRRGSLFLVGQAAMESRQALAR
jgi:hypothetical protein